MREAREGPVRRAGSHVIGAARRGGSLLPSHLTRPLSYPIRRVPLPRLSRSRRIPLALSRVHTGLLISRLSADLMCLATNFYRVDVQIISSAGWGEGAGGLKSKRHSFGPCAILRIERDLYCCSLLSVFTRSYEYLSVCALIQRNLCALL